MRGGDTAIVDESALAQVGEKRLDVGIDAASGDEFLVEFGGRVVAAPEQPQRDHAKGSGGEGGLGARAPYILAMGRVETPSATVLAPA